MMFGRLRRLPVETGRQLESMTYGIFAPVFLATAGLKLDVGLLFQTDLLWITVAMLATAAAGKLIGSFVGARYFGGIETRHAAAYGVALNARGVLGVIVASIGLSMGIFGVELYTMLVVVSLATSIMAPVGLRYLMKSESEATVSGKPSLTLNRILAPVRLREEGSPRSFDPTILSSLRGDSPAVTLMTVVAPKERRSASEYLTGLGEQVPHGLEVTKRVVTGDPVESIVAESEKGYDLVLLGAPEPTGGPDYLFEATLDEIVRLVACPSVIFSSRGSQWPPLRIMVPTGGAAAASRAADLAFALSGDESQVLLFHAIDPESSTAMSMSKQTTPASRLDVGQGVVSALRAVGEGMGVSVATEVVMGTGVVDSILERASQDIDLLILGTNVRAGSHRLYLGSKVERLLVESPCSTIVFNV
jgi:nucleotide-binding universal stress UspA family protein